MSSRPAFEIYSLLVLCVLASGTSPGQWVRVQTLPASDIPSLIVRGTTMYAGTDSAVFITTNGGDAWTRSAPLPGSPWFIDALAYLDGKLYAGTGGNGVFVSSDNGQNWMPLNQGLAGLGSSQISSFAIRNGVLYVGTRGAGVFQLQENIWSLFGDLAGQVAGDVEFLDVKGDTLAAGAGGNGYIWYAPAGATSWTGVRVAPLQTEAFVVHSLAAFAGALYIGTSYGIYRSTDNGESWTPSSEGILMNRIIKLSSKGDTLYASATAVVTHWYHSTDGLHWTFVEQVPLVYAFAFHANRLYTARIDGLWHKQLLPTSVEQSYTIPPRIALKQNYPNPFNHSTIITYDLPVPGHVTLTVYDVLGREIQILVNETQRAGRYTAEFVNNELASGVYVCRIASGHFVQTMRLLLQR